MKKLAKLLKDYRAAAYDPSRPFNERVFLVLSLVAEMVVIIALIGDIITHEDIREIVLISAVIIYVPIATIFGLYKNKLKPIMATIAIGLVFVVTPGLYFFGGGMYGGGVYWIIFSFLYIGLIMTGRWRTTLFALLALEAWGCIRLSYKHPEYVAGHTRSMHYVDAFISIILVGMVGFLMTWFQNLLFKDENQRAQKAAEKAEELGRAQNRFFSSMSHEIRTPINSILGLNELTLRNMGATPDIIKDAMGIQGAGKLLLALINDILDFSKMEAGSMEIIPVDYRVGDMISEIVNMIWIKAHDKGLKFDVSIDPDVPSVLYGDEVRIKQIIINLLNNAVKYTKEGSISLHIESETQEDEKTTLLNISVTDTGMGIKKEALPELFNAFKRVDEEKNRNIEGTGLGLSIVKQLIDLMEGDIKVSSVYGEGSTFTVTVKQGISDATEIGDLNIHNIQVLKREKYESNFKAPEARILIVDDNEMNLEVEKKLLADTQMTVDLAKSGREALEKSESVNYDVILMDHLMPQMDGIECLERLRSQTGGLNRMTPVVVLTANAGSDNRDLYNRAGFDGYLVKPVSGETLEDTLMKHISKDKLIITSRGMSMREDISATSGYTRKAPVMVTSTTLCDLPTYVIKNLKLSLLPFLIQTDEGVFKDGIQMDSYELIRYLSKGKNAISSPPDVKTYTEFFSNALRRAHHLIHISITSSMSDDYKIAMEAAKAFDNVTVINSESISSSTGLLVMIAHRLAQQGIPVDEMVSELEEVKKRLRCSFVIENTSYMAKKGLINRRVHDIARALSLHPTLRLNNNRAGVGDIAIGSTRRAYKRYIRKVIPVDIIPDEEVCFITYVDIPTETLEWIKEEISKIVYFKNVVFKQASAAISSNCGPGAFGIIYFVKSNKSYNLGAYVERPEADEADAVAAAYDADEAASDDELQEEKWYRGIPFIDGDAAIKNSGSEDAFKSVLQIYYDSIPLKSSELKDFYDRGDWEDYTIKIHALKSSAKLIGAIELSEKAYKLEMAGKEGNEEYIREHHDAFMEEYLRTGDYLKPVFSDGQDEEAGSDKPVADESIMASVFDGIKEAAERMDCDAIEEILEELSDYQIPDSCKEKYDAVIGRFEAFDYDGISEVLNAE